MFFKDVIQMWGVARPSNRYQREDHERHGSEDPREGNRNAHAAVQREDKVHSLTELQLFVCF